MQKFKNQDMEMKLFKDHVIRTIEEYDPKTTRGEFVWGKIGTVIYREHILFRPGTIILYGDLGTWVFRQDGIDMAWLRGSINGHPGYMLGKLTRERHEEYDSERTKENAYEAIKEKIENEHPSAEQFFGWRRTVESVDWESQEAAYDFFSDELEENDAYEYLSYTWEAAGGMWPWLILKTFMDAYDKKEAKS